MYMPSHRVGSRSTYSHSTPATISHENQVLQQRCTRDLGKSATCVPTYPIPLRRRQKSPLRVLAAEASHYGSVLCLPTCSLLCCSLDNTFYVRACTNGCRLFIHSPFITSKKGFVYDFHSLSLHRTGENHSSQKHFPLSLRSTLIRRRDSG